MYARPQTARPEVLRSISLVLTHREGFATAVRDGGIDGLIKVLADKNR